MKTYIFTLLLFCIHQTSSAQGTWTQKANFGDTERHSSVSFSIGTKGYILTGIDADSSRSDLWEWDQATDTWTEKARFPGTARYGAVSFSIGTKGYIGTGEDQDSLRSDFWEWDQATDTWSQKANFGGNARAYAVGFSIGDKGYIGTGADYVSVQGNTKDFWEYDQATDVWTQKSDLGGPSRRYATGFSIGEKGYILLGGETNIGSYWNDFWEWNKVTDTWTQIGEFPTNFPIYNRVWLVSFVIQNKAYIGTGFYRCGTNCVVFEDDIWEWDQTTEVWTAKTDFQGEGRDKAIGFSIGEKGYIGTGHKEAGYLFNDFWEYCPTCIPDGLNELNNQQNSSIIPNPFSNHTTLQLNEDVKNATVILYSVNGKQLKNLPFSGNHLLIEKDDLPSGIYFYQVISTEQVISSGKMIIQ